MSRLLVKSLCLTLAATLGLPAPLLAQGTYVGSATVVSQAAVSQDERDSLLAPIALYPDQLLAQVLMAATFPQDVTDAAGFMRQNPGLRGIALDNALLDRNWDPSVLSLTAYPQVLDMMVQRPDWTRRLGEAFYADQDGVMQTVQELRARAEAAGNLLDTPQQRVIYEDRSIIIEPARPEVIYIPTYNPLVVYGPWWAPAYPPYYWQPSRVYYPGVVIGVGLVGFGIAYAISNNHWGWARPDWRQRHIAIAFDGRNRFIDRRPYYRDWVRDGHWQRRPDQWRAQGGYARPFAGSRIPNAQGVPDRSSFVGRERGGTPPLASSPRQDRGRVINGETRGVARGDNGAGVPPRAMEGRPGRDRMMRPAPVAGPPVAHVGQPGAAVAPRVAPRVAPPSGEAAPPAAQGAGRGEGARGGERGRGGGQGRGGDQGRGSSGGNPPPEQH